MLYTSTLDLCIIAATNLWTVEDDAHIFVVASLISGSGEPTASQWTPMASAPYKNPITWNFTVHFAVSDLIPPDNDCVVVSLQVRCYYQGDHSYEEEIGEVYVPVEHLLDFKTCGPSQFVTYMIRDKSGAPSGELNLSYKLTGDGDSHRWWTPSAPPLPPPPPPDPPPPLAPGRGFPVKVAMVVAIVLVAPQIGELLVKVQELVVGVIALALVLLVVFGFLISLPDLLRRLDSHRACEPTAGRARSGYSGLGGW